MHVGFFIFFILITNSWWVLGSRLGKMMAKVGLVQLLKSFDFECADPNEIEFDNYAVTLIPRGGVEIRVVPRKD